MVAVTPGSEQHPDPRGFEGDVEKALTVLVRARALGAPWLAAPEISRILRDEFGIGIHWATVQTLLSDKRLAARRKRKGRWEFTLLTAGEERITKTFRRCPGC